jgi:hypothetical protein
MSGYYKNYGYGQRAIFYYCDGFYSIILNKYPFSNNSVDNPRFGINAFDVSDYDDGIRVYGTTYGECYIEFSELEKLINDNKDTLLFDIVTFQELNKDKTKTLEYIDHVVNKLNIYDTLLHLHLYLIINMIILGIELSCTEFFYKYTVSKENYIEHSKQIIIYNNEFYSQIINRINKIF